ncbi:hypothetical protein DFJ74DRAFT_603727 [Hyaloraphidium curvatum]|nr:hypothetical protein DFJ74DRAFT_603727 [Hyaloraphidium curvatum]
MASSLPRGAASPADVLAFWFPEQPPTKFRKEWFQKDAEFDKACASFVPTLDAAARGELDAWRKEPKSALALIIVADQFPRNVYRGTAKAFATDPLALSVAREVVEKGWMKELVPYERWFVLLPFEHSENIKDQDESVRLATDLVADHAESAPALRFAEQHREVIAKFGRFPHRNDALGRKWTDEERKYIAEGGHAF